MNISENTYHILLVEDNPGDAFLVKDYLSEKIINPIIDHVTNFQQAEALLKEKNFDIILLDLSLPDVNGKKLINKIVSLSRDTPILILTGFPDIDFSLDSLKLGVSDYLVKDELNATALFKSIVYNIERKKTFSRLETSEKRYSDLFHLSPQPMWVYNEKTLRFLDVNKAAIEKYGYNKEEFLKLKLTDIQNTFSGKLNALLQNTKGREKMFLQNLSQHKTKNGDLIKVEIKNTRINYKQGYAILCIATDISERLSYFQALKKQNEKLSEIAWIQSHMVRSPLTKIMGIVDLLKNEGISDEEFDYLIKSLEDSSKDLDQIIRKINKKSKNINLNQRLS